tara:strand:+ start:146 stop:583 length:438 start_codon:yes stop_codon:yes gene_type:complete
MKMLMNATLAAVTLVAGLSVAGAAGPAMVTVQESSLGAHLADGEGRSLYLFQADEPGKSTCFDACATAWPPLITQGQPEAGTDVNAKALGSLKRPDGTMQVTYNGWPLYYFIKDKVPGDTMGQDVKGFDAEWYLVTPSGKEVHSK